MAESMKEMSFWGHLEALRWVLIRVVIIYFIVVACCFIAMPYIFNEVILGPTTSDFILYKWLNGLHGDGTFFPDFGKEFKIDIINVKLASQFMTHISTSFFLGLLIIFPYLVFELWLFVRPALYEGERKSGVVVLTFGVPMFYLGCAVGYFIVFPFTFRFLATYELGGEIDNLISLSSYMDNFLMLVFVMGLVFELPFVAWVLSRMGFVTSELLKQIRKHAVVVLLILAAIITPTGDPFTLMTVFVPLYLLYELSVIMTKAKKKSLEDLDSDDDSYDLAKDLEDSEEDKPSSIIKHQ